MSAIEKYELRNIRIKFFSELTERPKFKVDINPNTEKPEMILGHYFLRPMVPCGIKGCHQPHNEGLLVRLSSGAEANFGIDCGAKYFGENFIALTEDFKQKNLLPQFRSDIAQAKSFWLPKRAEIALLDGKAIEVSHMLRRFLEIFQKTGKEISRRSILNEPTIFSEQRRSDKEVDDLLALNPSLREATIRFHKIPIGRLKGLAAFGLMHEVHGEIAAKLGELESLTPYTLSYAKAQPLVQWIDQLDGWVAKKKKFLDQAEQFFSKENHDFVCSIADPVELSALKDESFLELLRRPRSYRTVKGKSANDANVEHLTTGTDEAAVQPRALKSWEKMMFQYMPKSR